MKTYKELRNDFLNQVSEIDITKLEIDGFCNSLVGYARLLREISTVPSGEPDDPSRFCSCTVTPPHKGEED